MIGYTLTVTVAGVEQSVTLRAPDIIGFERHYNLPWQTLLSAQGREEWELFVAWHAFKRTGQTSKEFDDWIADLDSSVVVTPPAAKVGVGPLVPAPSPDSSPVPLSPPESIPAA